MHTETVACFKSALHKRDSIRALSPIVLIPELVLLRRRYRQIQTRAISFVGYVACEVVVAMVQNTLSGDF